MAGAIRSSKSSRPAGPTTNYAGNPPRPPNAWILYRSDMMKALSSKDPTKPSRPQSDISKQIAAMWRNETPQVRIAYEQASEARKAEHAEMYPNYRFQPLTREQKEKLREEKRMLREQAKAARQAAKGKRIGSGASSIGGPNASTAQSTKRVDASGLLAPYLNLTGPDRTPSSSQVAQSPTVKPPSASQLAGPSTSGFTASSLPQAGSSRDRSVYPAPPVVRQPPGMATPHPGVVSSGLPSPPWQGSLPQPDSSPLPEDSNNFSMEFLLNAPELNFSQGDNPFSGFDTSNSLEFDFSGNMPSLEASGDPAAYQAEQMDQIIADMVQTGSFDFNMPMEDYNSFLIDYDPTKSGYFDFSASGSSPEALAEPREESTGQPAASSSANLNDINSLLRIASQATNNTSAVSPFSHVSPSDLMSRTPSHNVPPRADATPMSPVSAMSSPGVASAPEASTTPEGVSRTHRTTVPNTSARRVGGDWRSAFQQRISS